MCFVGDTTSMRFRTVTHCFGEVGHTHNAVDQRVSVASTVFSSQSCIQCPQESLIYQSRSRFFRTPTFERKFVFGWLLISRVLFWACSGMWFKPLRTSWRFWMPKSLHRREESRRMRCWMGPSISNRTINSWVFKSQGWFQMPGRKMVMKPGSTTLRVSCVAVTLDLFKNSSTKYGLFILSFFIVGILASKTNSAIITTFHLLNRIKVVYTVLDALTCFRFACWAKKIDLTPWTHDPFRTCQLLTSRMQSHGHRLSWRRTPQGM